MSIFNIIIYNFIFFPGINIIVSSTIVYQNADQVDK